VFLRALTDKTAESIGIQLLDIFCEYGFPRIIMSDNAKDFVNSSIDFIREKAKIDKKIISPYNPSTNGLIERSVKDFMNVMVKTIEKNEYKKLALIH